MPGSKDGRHRRYPFPTAAWVRILARACEKVASDLGICGVFRRALRFPLSTTTVLACHDFAEKATRMKIKSLIIVCDRSLC